MPRVKFTLSIGYPGAEQEDEIEIDDDEWAECETEEQQEKLMFDYWTEWSCNYIDGGPQLIEDE